MQWPGVRPAKSFAPWPGKPVETDFVDTRFASWLVAEEGKPVALRMQWGRVAALAAVGDTPMVRAAQSVDGFPAVLQPTGSHISCKIESLHRSLYCKLYNARFPPF